VKGNTRIGCLDQAAAKVGARSPSDKLVEEGRSCNQDAGCWLVEVGVVPDIMVSKGF